MNKTKKIAAFFGIGFIIAILIIAIFIPYPTKFQYIIFKTVIAIAISGFASTIPGLIEVEISKFIKTGGAIAVFVVTYF